jgi:hypothetical protein
MALSLANRAAEALNPVDTAGLKALLEARKALAFRRALFEISVSSIEPLRPGGRSARASGCRYIPPEHLKSVEYGSGDTEVDGGR